MDSVIQDAGAQLAKGIVIELTGEAAQQVIAKALGNIVVAAGQQVASQVADAASGFVMDLLGRR